MGRQGSEAGDVRMTEATDRLIAAAPDLLAALEGVTRTLKAFSYSNTFGKTQRERLDKANAAITKARGGSHD